MLPFLGAEFGNPSSLHRAGIRVARAVTAARESVATLTGARVSEVVFTSSGTEAAAAAILGALEATPARRHVVATEVEHPCVLDLLRALQRAGRIDLDVVAPRNDGVLDAERVLARLRPDTALVSVMWANNETGMLHPVQEIAEGCRRGGVLFHTDAVQAAGKVAIDLATVPADLLTLSAHKFHGPKGVGVLVIRRGTPWKPAPAFAGHQERGRRGGTENVPGIVGTGVAAREAMAGIASMGAVAALRDRLEDRILAAVRGAKRATAAAPRVPNTSLLLVPGIEGEAVLLQMDARGIAVSSGSACTAGSMEPSHVLTALGVPGPLARSAVRFSLSRHTTEDEVDRAADAYIDIIEHLRSAGV
jgi:cysteine desulfurase